MTPCRLAPFASLLLVTLSAACGGADPPVTPCPAAPEAFACVDGATLALIPDDPYPACTEGLVPVVERALEIAGEVWGADPADLLVGWTIDFSMGWYCCHTVPADTWTYGCTIPARRLIKVAPGDVARCLPGVLIHEFGHVLLGDPAHLDPRFAIASALEGEPCR